MKKRLSPRRNDVASRIKLTFASNVFPQPGGPASSIPGGTVSPSASNSSGFCTGALEEVKQMFYKRSRKQFNGYE